MEGSDDGMGEQDLLGFDMDSTPAPVSASALGNTFSSNDPFAPSPGPGVTSAPPTVKNVAAVDLLSDSLLDMNIAPLAPTAPTAASNFNSNPFGSTPAPAPAYNDPFLSSAAPPASTPRTAVDVFDVLGGGNLSTPQPTVSAPTPDPFQDPFGFGVAAPSAPAPVASAPPLTPSQVAQHRTWFMNALAVGGGPLYDDGSLQIASKLETRGSQARLTLFLRNPSSSPVDDLALTLSVSHHVDCFMLRTEIIIDVNVGRTLQIYCDLRQVSCSGHSLDKNSARCKSCSNA